MSSERGLLRVPAGPLEVGSLELSSDASHYVTRVHRRRVGDEVLLFDPSAGLEAPAVIVAIHGKTITARVDEVRLGKRCGVPGLHLVQGLGKGDKPDQVVRVGVVLGAQSLHFVACERSVVQPTTRDAAKQERMVRVAVEAARQCGRSNLPRLQLGETFDALLLRDVERLDVVLQPGPEPVAVERVLEGADPAPSDVYLWVGPEGGFSENELATLHAQGGRLASLGDLTLRTELAAVVGLARAGAWLSQRQGRSGRAV